MPSSLESGGGRRSDRGVHDASGRGGVVSFRPGSLPRHCSLEMVSARRSEVHQKRSEVYLRRSDVHSKRPEDHLRKSEVHLRRSEDHLRRSEVYLKGSEIHLRRSKVHLRRSRCHVSVHSKVRRTLRKHSHPAIASRGSQVSAPRPASISSHILYSLNGF